MRMHQPRAAMAMQGWPAPGEEIKLTASGLGIPFMLRRISGAVVFALCAIAGVNPAGAVDCGLGLGFVPATISASPARIQAGESIVLSIDLGKPVWFECDGGTNPVSRIFNRRVLGLTTLQIYSGDGQFAHFSSPTGFHVESFFTYLNEGRFQAGGVGSAPVISGDPDMLVIGTARVLFDQKLTHFPSGETETYKDRSVSILVFARPATVTVLADTGM